MTDDTDATSTMRWLSEDTLRRLFPLLSAFLDPLTDGLLIQNADRSFIFANATAARVCGYDSPVALMHSPTEEVFARFTPIDATGQPLPHDALPAYGVSATQPVIEERVRWRSIATGEERCSVLKAVWVPDSTGALAYLVHIVRDITEQVRAEEARRASEARFRALVERSAEGIVLLDASGIVLSDSVHSVGILGYGPGDMAGQGFATWIHPEDLPHIRAMFTRLLATPGASATAECRMRHRDGMWRWVEGTATNMLIDPDVGAIVVNYRDISERKAAEHAREEERARLRAVLDVLPVGIVVADADGRLQMANDALRALFGGAAPLVETVPAYAVYRGRWAATDRPLAPDEWALARALATGEAVHGDEVIIEGFDGTERRIVNNAAPVRDAAGTVVGGVAAAYDITDRVRAEERMRLLAEVSVTLAESLDYEETLRRVTALIVPRIADGCLVEVLDADGVPRAIAHAHRDPTKDALAAEMWRRYPATPDDALGTVALARSGRPRLVPTMDDALLRARARDAEHLRMLRALGFHSLMQVPLVARGRALGVLALIAETSGRFGPEDLAFAEELGRRCALAIDNARLYRDAQAAELRFRSLFEQVPDTILVADEQARYIDANAAATALLGYTREELLHLTVPEVVALPAAETRSVYRGFVEAGYWRGELDLRCKDGSIVPVEAMAMPVAVPGATWYVSIIRDITERRAQERMQQEFLSMIAHEMRTPLTAVRGYVDLMRKRGTYNERHVETIATQTRRLNRLVNDALETSRLEARRLELHREEVDLREVVRQSVEEVQETEATHALRLDLSDHPLIGWWDPDRLAEVVQNLVMNAVKYSPAGSIVQVEVRDAGDDAVVAVRDEGIGIPPEDLPHLFDRFYRAGNAASARGMGLGLYITKGLVEAHGGELTVASTLGVGSTFTVTLPRNAPPDAG